ncbi:hypothetical protein [Pelagicoccus mobilis]|uniref:Uncharacterized protein n=1 Tax=Pelagicoccus mobilis TaxID=415221 RepID=A0A934RVU2_9BACT|nr:hypothetical protein [Pelagicoccus mobilis]MBK1876089.1 hypothetical protein [Pelagicoccus mobilis]
MGSKGFKFRLGGALLERIQDFAADKNIGDTDAIREILKIAFVFYSSQDLVTWTGVPPSSNELLLLEKSLENIKGSQSQILNLVDRVQPQSFEDMVRWREMMATVSKLRKTIEEELGLLRGYIRLDSDVWTREALLKLIAHVDSQDLDRKILRQLLELLTDGSPLKGSGE